VATIIQGAAGTANINQDLLVRDVYDKIMATGADLKKLAIVLNKLGKIEKAVATKVEHFERDRKDFQFQLGAAFTYASDTTITVPDGVYQQLVAGTVLKSQKWGSQYIVAATPTTTTVTLKGTANATVWGESAGHDMAEEDYISILGVASEEGSAVGDVAMIEPDTKFNYITIAEEPFEVTKTDDLVRQYGKPQGDYEDRKLQAVDLFQVQEELKLLYGEKKRDTSGSHPRQMMGGLLKFMLDGGNLATYGPSLTDAVLIDFIELCSQKTSDTGLLLCSSTLMGQLTKLAYAKVVIDTGREAKYGFRIYEIEAGSRTIYATRHLLISGDMEGDGFLVTMDNMAAKELSAFEIEDDIQAKDVKKRKGVVRRRMSVRLSRPLDFGVLQKTS